MALHPVKENAEESLNLIARMIGQEREKQNLDQRDLAERVGTTQTSIRRLEKGETNVAAVLLIRVAKTLGMDVTELLEPIQSAQQLVDRTYEESNEEITRAVSHMGLTQNDTDDFYTRRDLLRLMKLWPR